MHEDGCRRRAGRALGGGTKGPARVRNYQPLLTRTNPKLAASEDAAGGEIGSAEEGSCRDRSSSKYSGGGCRVARKALLFRLRELPRPAMLRPHAPQGIDKLFCGN